MVCIVLKYQVPRKGARQRGGSNLWSLSLFVLQGVCASSLTRNGIANRPTNRKVDGSIPLSYN